MAKSDRKPVVVNVTRYLDRQPPAAPEAEAAVLGSLILEDGRIPDVMAILHGPDDFWRPANAAIYAALVAMWEAGSPVDMTLLYRRLEDGRRIESVGGLDYLVELAESVPNAATCEYYAGVVREKARLRAHVQNCGQTLHDVYEGGASADEIDQALFAKLIDQSTPVGEVIEQGELVSEVYDQIDRRAQLADRALLGLPTGILNLDHKLSGCEPGTVTVLAGRSSQGKTSLALQIAESFAAHDGKPVVFCLEMNRQQLGYRMLAGRSGVEAWRLRKAEGLTRDHFATLSRAVGDLSQHPIRYAMTPGLTTATLRAMVARLVKAGKCGSVFIDHLGLMRAPRAENRNIALGDITREIKIMAEEYEIPVVLLCQLNRGAANGDQRPGMHHLRESGHIEEDADNVLLIHRPEFIDRTAPGYTPDDLEPCYLLLEKNRQGPVGSIDVLFDGSVMRFKSAAMRHAAGSAA